MDTILLICPSCCFVAGRHVGLSLRDEANQSLGHEAGGAKRCPVNAVAIAATAYGLSGGFGNAGGWATLFTPNLARFCQLRVQVAHHAAVDSAMVANDVMSGDPADRAA
jgi:hypothetical protein